MDTDAVKLEELRIQAGRTLLKMMDDMGFEAVGAAWVYSRAADMWWYLLVTPMVDSKGPKWIYERLLKVFQKWQLPEGVSPLDIRIASPREQAYRNFPIKALDPSSAETAMRVDNMTINGIPIDAMVIYRMRPLDNRSGERTRIFESRVRELLAA